MHQSFTFARRREMSCCSACPAPYRQKEVDRQHLPISGLRKSSARCPWHQDLRHNLSLCMVSAWFRDRMALACYLDVEYQRVNFPEVAGACCFEGGSPLASFQRWKRESSTSPPQCASCPLAVHRSVVWRAGQRGIREDPRMTQSNSVSATTSEKKQNP